MQESGYTQPRFLNGTIAFWALHTLMLALFLLLEGVGFRLPVGSSVFWFTWIAVWLIHGMMLFLGRLRDHEQQFGDAHAANVRFRRRLVLAGHAAFYLAFGPAVLLWWLVARPPGPQQPGEGQGLWIYPLWLMILLLHGLYVSWRERQITPQASSEKRKRDFPDVERLLEREDLDDHGFGDENLRRRSQD